MQESDFLANSMSFANLLMYRLTIILQNAQIKCLEII